MSVIHVSEINLPFIKDASPRDRLIKNGNSKLEFDKKKVSVNSMPKKKVFFWLYLLFPRTDDDGISEPMLKVLFDTSCVE